MNITNQTSSTYCNEPWKTIHYDQRGVMGPCCTYRGDRDESLESVKDYLKSDWLKELQRKKSTKIFFLAQSYCESLLCIESLFRGLRATRKHKEVLKKKLTNRIMYEKFSIARNKLLNPVKNTDAAPKKMQTCKYENNLKVFEQLFIT